MDRGPRMCKCEVIEGSEEKMKRLTREEKGQKKEVGEVYL